MNRISHLLDQAIAFPGEVTKAVDEQIKLKTAMYVLKISGLTGYAKPPIQLLITRLRSSSGKVSGRRTSQ